MRNTVLGAVVGIIAGTVIGATLVAPHLIPPNQESSNDAGSKPAQDALVQAQMPVVQADVSWKMAAAYRGSLPQLGTLGKRIEKSIWRVSAGTVEIRFHEPGELVSRDHVFDALTDGRLDAAFSSPLLWADKAPALALFGAVPFGPSAPELLAWFSFGEGKTLYDSIYQKLGVHGVLCGINTAQASGWFKKPIKTLDELKTKRVRIVGLGAEVFEKLGIETTDQRDGALMSALDNDTVNGAIFAMPAVDHALEFHRLAKHYYFPGWQQPTTLFDLVVNQERWDALTSIQQTQIETVCGDNVRYGLAESEALQYGALKDFVKKGVEIHRWPTEIMEAFAKSWSEVVAERGEADKTFKAVWASLSAFRKDYAVWRDLNKL